MANSSDDLSDKVFIDSSKFVRILSASGTRKLLDHGRMVVVQLFFYDEIIL